MLVAAGLPLASAHASSFLTPLGTRADPVSYRVLIAHDKDVETLIDEIELVSTGSAYVWLRAFPSRPLEARPIDAALFANLEAATEVREPHHEQLRHNLFGPSVVTLLTRQLLAPPHPASKLPSTAPSNRALTFSSVSYFAGRAETSSITHRPMLPADLVRYVARETVAIDSATETQIADYLNRGYVIMAAVVHDERPSATTSARIGPFLHRFETPKATYPIVLDDSRAMKLFRFYIVSSRVLAPSGYDTTWDTDPWDRSDRVPGVFYATNNRRIGPSSPLALELVDRAGLRLQAEARAVRSDFVLSPSVHRDIELAEAPRAVPLPAPGARGSARDLFLTVLLALTPLLYTPESWFFLWLEARARARARQQTANREPQAAGGIKLWALFAVAVACFWFFKLEGSGRVAAIIPGLIGVFQLALPRTESAPHPIRVHFRRKKK